MACPTRLSDQCHWLFFAVNGINAFDSLTLRTILEERICFRMGDDKEIISLLCRARTRYDYFKVVDTFGCARIRAPLHNSVADSAAINVHWEPRSPRGFCFFVKFKRCLKGKPTSPPKRRFYIEKRADFKAKWNPRTVNYRNYSRKNVRKKKLWRF